MDPPSGSPRHCTQPKPCAGWTERGAFRPPGCSAGKAECRVSHVSELAFGPNMPHERLVSSRLRECRQVADVALREVIVPEFP